MRTILSVMSQKYIPVFSDKLFIVFIKLSRDRSVSDPEAEVLSVLSFSSKPFPNSILSASFQLRNHDIEQAISILDIVPK